MSGFLIFLGVIALVIAIGVLKYKMEAKRREELATLAMQGGWVFSPAKDYGIGRLCDFDIFNRGEDRCAFNTITGKVEYGAYHCELDMGDFRYTVRTRTSKGHTSKTTYKFSYLVIRLPFRHTPQVRIRHEGILDKIAQAAGLEDIDFESAEFSDKYCVTSRDKLFTYHLLHPRAMEYFLAIEPPDLIEIAAGRICVTDGMRRWKMDAFKKRMNWARNFVALWPEHLARDLQKRSI